jgi:hypothetical protein
MSKVQRGYNTTELREYGKEMYYNHCYFGPVDDYVSELCEILQEMYRVSVRYDDFGHMSGSFATKYINYSSKYIKLCKDHNSEIYRLNQNIGKAADLLDKGSSTGVSLFKEAENKNSLSSPYGNGSSSIPVGVFPFGNSSVRTLPTGTSTFGNSSHATSTSSTSTSTPRINSPYDALEYYKKQAEEERRKGNTEAADRWKKRADDLDGRLHNTSTNVETPNQDGNKTTNNGAQSYSPYPSNTNTNSNTTDNGARRNIETEEENKQHQEEERKHQEEEKKRQEAERKRQEEEKKHQEEERKRQEEEKKRQEAERKRQEEEKKHQEEERKRQEEERKHQEEERKRQEEQSASAGSDVATPPIPDNSNNRNGSNNGTSVPIPNTETHSDNPVAAGIDKVVPEKTGESSGTSIVGEAKDLFKNKGKSTPDSKPVLPKSESTKSSSSSSSKGFNPVPLAVGLGAAVAGGVGIKAYKDHKENSSFNDENEDSFSNGNRFWSEDDPNVINSEEDMVSGDDLFSEQTTSPSYSAMINENNNNSDEGWTLDEQEVESDDSFDLLGDN